MACAVDPASELHPGGSRLPAALPASTGARVALMATMRSPGPWVDRPTHFPHLFPSSFCWGRLAGCPKKPRWVRAAHGIDVLGPCGSGLRRWALQRLKLVAAG